MQTVSGNLPAGMKSYDVVQNAMIGDENAENDVNGIVGHLPTLGQFRPITPKRLTALNVLQEI